MVVKYGRFITLEGPEGSGKSTQIVRLARKLKALGIAVYCTREPGGTPAGDAIRHLLQHAKEGEDLCPEAELLLFAASRAQHVRQVILPRLARGEWVISDRFADSTTAYQGYARELGVDTVLRVNRFAVGQATPSLTLLIDIDVRAGFRRIRGRNAHAAQGRDRIERETVVFHDCVRRGYLALARRFPDRIKRIDGNQPPEVVEAAIWKVVARVFRKDI